MAAEAGDSRGGRQPDRTGGEWGGARGRREGDAVGVVGWGGGALRGAGGCGPRTPPPIGCKLTTGQVPPSLARRWLTAQPRRLPLAEASACHWPTRLGSARPATALSEPVSVPPPPASPAEGLAGSPGPRAGAAEAGGRYAVSGHPFPPGPAVPAREQRPAGEHPPSPPFLQVFSVEREGRSHVWRGGAFPPAGSAAERGFALKLLGLGPGLPALPRVLAGPGPWAPVRRRKETRFLIAPSPLASPGRGDGRGPVSTSGCGRSGFLVADGEGGRLRPL